MSAGTSPTPTTNLFIFCKFISFPLIKEKEGHLSTVATNEQVEIGLFLQTRIKEYNTFDKRVWDIHVHRHNKDMDMSLLMAVANYELDEYRVKRICFKGGSREALRDWRVLLPRSFEVCTGQKDEEVEGRAGNRCWVATATAWLEGANVWMLSRVTAGTQVFYSWHSRARLNIIPISKKKTPASTAVNPADRLQREQQDRGWLADRQVTYDCLGLALSP